MSEFLPFIVPNVSAEKPAPAEPINWYRHIAPQLSAPTDAAPQRNAPDPDSTDGKAAVHAALFRSVEEIAERERRRIHQGEPEPADIVQMRREAAEEASRAVHAARQEADQIRQASREEGYPAGYQAGYAAGEQDAIRTLTQRANDERSAYQQDMSAFIAYIEAASRHAWIEMEPEILELVFEIARKVIKMEVEINRNAALEVVRNTLRRVADTTTLRVRVHADDLETVRGNREDLLTLVDSMRHVEIVEDRRVGIGGCIVETDAGTIDARIETQFEEIHKLLRQPA